MSLVLQHSGGFCVARAISEVYLFLQYLLMGRAFSLSGR